MRRTTQAASVNERITTIPVGYCIYCGARENLSDEHAVPRGLAGDFVLRKATCPACCVETSKIERAVLREHFTGPRLAVGYPSRRKHSKVPPYPPILGRTKGGTKHRLVFQNMEHPTLLWLPQFEVPASVSGKSVLGINVNGVEMRQLSGIDIHAHAQRSGFDEIEISQNVRGYEFARLLAKISLCFAAHKFGSDFETSPLASTILAKQNDAGRWVGQPTACPPPIADTFCVANGLHIVKIYRNTEIWVIIRLFAPHNSSMDYLSIVEP